MRCLLSSRCMIKGSEIRRPDFPIEKLLFDRWSPRAMSGEEISEKELMRLFEAARWAPSSFNGQQWRALYARRGTEYWQTFSICSSTRTRPGQRTLPFWSCSFRESFSITTTSRRSLIRMMLARRGRTSRCKASIKVWWYMEWKDSITSARAKTFGYPKTSRSKRWPRSASRVRKNYFLRN